MKSTANTFHIIPPERERHGYDTESIHNVTFLDKKLIDRVRRLYNGKTPLEQLALYYLINREVLSADVRASVKDLVSQEPFDFFDERILHFDQDPKVRQFVQYAQDDTPLFINKSGQKPRKNERDLHHLIPSSRQDEGFDTGLSINKFRDIGRKFHQYWHSLYSNKHPIEILRDDFNRNMQVLSRETRRKLGEIVVLDNDEFYTPEIVKVENRRR